MQLDTIRTAHMPNGTKWLRSLRVAEGNVARWESAADNPDRVRIAIRKAETRVAYDIQLNLPRLAVRSGHQYALSFLARSDEPRAIGVGCARDHAPWSNLGLYTRIDLVTEWRSFELSFVATEDQEDARIHYDVGENGISVEISAVALRSLSDGRFVHPGLPAPTETSALQSTPIEPSVGVGAVSFGLFGRLTPIGDNFGLGRGRPIDRYYIERFLASHREDVRGRVLEIRDNVYTRRFGGDRVTKSDVIDVVASDPHVTIVADLSSAAHIPANAFDCIIFTQTLQFIYDSRAVLRTLQRILRPGGVLLATFSGISQNTGSKHDDAWYWNFTSVSARRLFEEAFAPTHVAIDTFGNVLAAMSFLHGLAFEELRLEELDYKDPAYEVIIAVRAEKPASDCGHTGVTRHTSHPVRQASGGKALILLYHRVTTVSSDPWSLCVSPRHFSEHLETLHRLGELVPLQHVLTDAARWNSSKPIIALTFDDGYVDNLMIAKPILDRYGVPATVFVTTGYVGGRREFWWDELERLMVSPVTLPQFLELTLRGKGHRWAAGEERLALCKSVRQALLPLTDAEREDAFNQLEVWSGSAHEVRPTHRALTGEEIVDLARGDLIEIGAHTVTHPVLLGLSTAEQENELRRCKATLEGLVDKEITSFAYPYGSFDAAATGLVRDIGFARACTTSARLVGRGTDPYRLPRFGVLDWNGEELNERLWMWLAGDA